MTLDGRPTFKDHTKMVQDKAVRTYINPYPTFKPEQLDAEAKRSPFKTLFISTLKVLRYLNINHYVVSIFPDFSFHYLKIVFKRKANNSK
jgi:hypothetical protein